MQPFNSVLYGLFSFSEESLVPYSKPSFPSPGGHSSSGTSSSKGSTGPRKADVLRGSHQRNANDLLDIGYVGSNSQGQFTGELCKFFGSFQRPLWLKKNSGLSRAWCRTPLIPALGRQRQADFWVRGQPGLQSEFQDSQGYREKPCLRKKQTNKKPTATTTK